MLDLINVNYDTMIPNNVGLSEDRKVLKALEKWHPGYINWWNDLIPQNFQDSMVYLRTAVSVGAAKAVLVPITESDWDPQRTAQAIASVITDLENANGKFDLVLFGNESADSCGYQVGIRVALTLGRPMVNGAKGLEIEGTVAKVRRESDAGMEIYLLPMPSAVGVKEGINLPRYPTMKGRLASKKVDVTRTESTGSVGGLKMIQLQRPPERVSNTQILGTGPEAASAVVDLLEELGVFK